MPVQIRSTFDFVALKPVLKIPSWAWILSISLLFTLTTLGHFFEVQATGKIAGVYGPSVSILFVPIYEEVLFRGILLAVFLREFSALRAVALSSALFGLWHLKNIFWLKPLELEQQIAYTALFFGPIMAWITLKTRSIWPAVVLHYLNNFNAPLHGWMMFLGK